MYSSDSSILSSGVPWIFLMLLLGKGCVGKRNWDYEPVSIEVNSSDESKVKIEAGVERILRDYAITAHITFNYDMDETTMVELTAYRSSTGGKDDYKLLPWSIPLQTFEQFADDYYKNVAYKNLHHCSNIPEPDNVYPIPHAVYDFNQCVVTGEGMPEIAAEGYYKIILKVTGEVECGFVAIVKLITKTDLMG